MILQGCSGLTEVSSIIVGGDGDADDVLVPGAEDQRHQQEDEEKGTGAPDRRIMRWKIYMAHVCVPVTRGTYENKLNCKLFGRRVTFAYDPPSCHGSGSASSATWTWTPETEDTSSQPPCTQH